MKEEAGDYRDQNLSKLILVLVSWEEDSYKTNKKFEQESTIIVRNVRKHHQEQPTNNPKSWSFGLPGVSGGHQQLHLPTCSKNPTASGAQ